MKNICVISGTRADYGLLYFTMKSIQAEPSLNLQTIVTCMHLDPKFGDTWKQFEEDNIPITIKVDLGKLEDGVNSVVNQISTGVKEFYSSFDDLKPDLIVILGDRYEMLAAAQAAVLSDIPIAHIHGGEVTEGAFDDFIRHSITKMSTYHFTSTDTYRNRVIQMGEYPENVLNVGALGLENIVRMKLESKKEIENSLNFQLRDQNFLVTYHPVTADSEDATGKIIDCLGQYPNIGQIITMPNSDPGHEKIFNALSEYASNRDNVYLTKSLGFRRYLSVMNFCDVVIGNSSSGIIEAPFMGIPTLNIGVRQKGRLSDRNVIHSEVGNINESLIRAMEMDKFKSYLYGDGTSSSKILGFLINKNFQTKRGFYDG